MWFLAGKLRPFLDIRGNLRVIAIHRTLEVATDGLPIPHPPPLSLAHVRFCHVAEAGMGLGVKPEHAQKALEESAFGVSSGIGLLHGCSIVHM